MRLVAGLGNPGEKYADTRHNIGFMVLDELAGRLGAGAFRKHCRSLVAETRQGGDRLVLAKPQTFMNKSGEALASLLGWYKVPLSNLLVVYDDMDLPLGQLRLRAAGSAGSHNGMRSIISCLGARDIPRLRVGIGQAPGVEAVSHVLGHFAAAERPLVDAAVQAAADAVEMTVACGLEAAMNRFNARLS